MYSGRLASGERVYWGTTSTGRRLNAETRHRTPDDLCEAMILHEMWGDLDRQDPVPIHPTLSLWVGGARRPN